MKKGLTWLAVSFFLVYCTGCTHPTNIDSYLNNQHDAKKLNGSVLVAKNGSVIYEKSFGYADGSKTKSLTSDYYFGIGSIEKEFTAVAIMQLKEKGSLSLNDTLSVLLPGFPAWANTITVRHLLQYSSGLPTIDWDSYFKGGNVSEEAVLKDLKSITELEFDPGTDYIYSNYNIFILRRIVEAKSNQEFSEYVQNEILNPYKLDGIVIEDGFPFQDTELRAIPFDENFTEDSLKYDLSILCSTSKGMFHWFNRLDNFEIITKESLRFLSQEAISGNNIQAPIGRGDWENDSLNLHLHHGSSHNYEALVRHHKKDGIMIIFLTNQKHSNLHEMADQVFILAKEHHLPLK